MARLKMGMVGGGLESMAGRLHRHAAALDGGIEFVAGALASSPARADAAAQAFHIPRSYPSWQQMLEAEQRLPQGERIDFVVIATPNHLHFPVAKASLAAGFDVKEVKEVKPKWRASLFIESPITQSRIANSAPHV